MPPTRTIEARVRHAKSVATRAINKAATVAADPSKARSTRTRKSYQVKADALDDVARILAE